LGASVIAVTRVVGSKFGSKSFGCAVTKKKEENGAENQPMDKAAEGGWGGWSGSSTQKFILGSNLARV
jgi:hypothetical protein